MNPAPVAPHSLPRDGFTRLCRVFKLCSMGRTTIWRRMSQGQFPQAIRLGPRTSVVRNSDLLDWFADPVNWRAPNTEAPRRASVVSPKPSKGRKHSGAAA
jgi:prophage regulatory protein